MYDPLRDDVVADLLERQLGDHDWHVDLVSQSSNYIYRCTGRDATVAVRVPRVRMETPSHYWRQMRELFDLDFPPAIEQLEVVGTAIKGAGLICPEVLGSTVIDSRPVIVTTWVTGDAWEPDQFPPSPGAHRALGVFLAKMHEASQGGFGNVGSPLREPSEYYAAAIASARQTVEIAWTKEADSLVTAMATCDPAAVASSFALVMPDISGNQFLFDNVGIAAVVDLDSYVVGPVELELTIAEWCLVDHAAFADGYQSVRPLPKFERFRSFHRATMLVNEEAVAGDVHRLLEDNAYFD